MLRGASAADRPVVAGLGFYPGFANTAGLSKLESWLGRDAHYVVQFADANASRFTGSVWGQVGGANAWRPVSGRTTLVESIPLAFGSNLNASTTAGQAQVRSNLQTTINGTYDEKYLVAARYLRDGGYEDAIIRLGWEFDGTWMPWSSVGNQDSFVKAFRHVHDLFTSVSPKFRFDWTGDRGYLQGQIGAYPGDDYVDIIGIDVYDKAAPGGWNPATKSWVDPVGAWKWVLPNLTFHRDFALAHGKQLSYPEWGLASGGTQSPTSAGGDNPTFIQGMFDWMNSLPTTGAGSLAYHSYFNSFASNDGDHALDKFPKSQARFRSLFGPASGSSPSTAAPAPTTVAPTTTTTVAPTTTTTVAPTTTTTEAPTTTTTEAPTTTTTEAPTTTTTVAPGPAPTIAVPATRGPVPGVSDLFDSDALRQPLWTYANPARDTRAWVIGSDLTLVAFQGVPHSLTAAGDKSVRIVQSLGKGDFTVDTAYKSRLTSDNAWQGISFDLGNRTLVQAARQIHGVDYVQVSVVDSAGTHVLSSERMVDNGAWHPIFRATRLGDRISLSWSVGDGGFSDPVITSGGNQLKTFAVATGNDLNGKSAPRHVAVVDSVRFRA